MSLIPHKSEKTRHWKQRWKSSRGMRAGRLWALFFYVCCCQTKFLCCWEVFPCSALSNSIWDLIYYHQIHYVMNALGKNKHIVAVNAKRKNSTAQRQAVPPPIFYASQNVHSRGQHSHICITFLHGILFNKETTGITLEIKLLLHWLNSSLFCTVWSFLPFSDLMTLNCPLRTAPGVSYPEK